MEEKTEKKLREIVESGKGRKIIFEGNSIYINQKMIAELKREDEKEGGVIPLLALLPAIIAGLSGVAGIAGGVASTVKNAKEAQVADARKELLEAQKQKIIAGKGVEIESIEGEGFQNGIIDIIPDSKFKGEGIFLNPYEGKGMSDILRSILKKDEERKNKIPLKKIFKKLGKGDVGIIRQGEGIFLQPYKQK